MILHLGVIDIPYATRVPDEQRRVVVRSRPGQKPKAHTAPPSGGETTGDVATYLEDKYHVIEIFTELYGEKIELGVGKAVSEAIENRLLGGPADSPAFAGFTSELETLFRKMLDSQELDGLGYPGIPTEAAKRGVNHRMKHPYAKRDPRASFVDTGQYQASFRAWTDD